MSESVRSADSGRLRVVFTTDCYYPHIGGGTEVVVRRLAESLAARHHESHVVTLNTRGAHAYDLYGGVHVHRLPTLDLTNRIGLQLALSPSFFGRIGGLLDDIGPDIVNAHNVFFPTCPLAVMAAVGRRIPTILTLHLNSPTGLRFPASAVAAAYESTIGMWTARRSTEVVAVGPSVAAHARDAWKLSRSPLVIPNGVDADLFAPGHSRSARETVLFVGRLVPNKGPQFFLAAARYILARRAGIEFWIVGDGPLRTGLERATSGDSRIRFLGERSDVAELMRSASVFVRPSTLEGFPLTILEAMASGLPVVASDVPGNSDLVEDGRTGLLCAPRSPRALAEAIETLLDDRSLADRLAGEARSRVVARFTWGEAALRFEALARRLRAEARSE